jgi:hypothetical protein
MSVAQYVTRQGITDRCWKTITEVREKALVDELMDHIDLSRYRDTMPTPEETKAFLSVLVEMAWKAGFADCLYAFETESVVITKPETN